MKRTYFIFLLSTLLIFTACKTPNILNQTVIEGRIINILTNEPIEGVEVDLHEKFDAIAPRTDNILERAQTDEQGNFRFKFPADVSPYAEYSIEAKLAGIMPGLTKNLEESAIAEGEYNFFELEVAPTTHFLLRLESTDCFSGTSIQVYQDREVQPQNLENPFFLYENCHSGILEENTHMIAGTYYYNWIIKKNGGERVLQDTVFLSPGEFKEYVIEY